MLIAIAPRPTHAGDTCVGDGLVLGDDETQDLFALGRDADALYLVGDDNTPGNGEFRIEKRALGDAGLVPAFGTAGVVRSNPTVNWDVPRAVAVDAGAIYVGGDDGRAGGAAQTWRIEKRNTVDGTLVSTFGSGGVVSVPSSGDYDHPDALVAAGTALYAAGTVGFTWRIEKRNLSDGSLVGGFGTGGVVTGASGEAFAMTLAGNVLWVAGSDGFSSWRIEQRDPATGALLHGVSETFADVGCGPQGMFAIAVDASGVYVAGEASGQWRVERRSVADGSLVYNQWLPGSGSCDAARAVVLDAGAVYVAGESDHRWRIEKRTPSTGGLMTGFGSGGVVTSGSFFSGAYAALSDGAALWVAGFDDVAGSDYQWRLEHRSLADGSLLPCGTPATTTTTTITTATTTTTMPSGPCVPATLSDCKTRVHFAGATPPRDRASVRCTLTLGPGSNGIDPVREGIRVLLTDADSDACAAPCFAQTVAPVRIGKCWRYRDPRATGLRTVVVCDVDPPHGVYKLSARTAQTNLQCLNAPAPYTVAVNIGDDCTAPCGGTTTTTLPGPCGTTSAYPSSVTNASGSRAWQNPGNIVANDTLAAVLPNLAPGEVSDVLVADHLGFALPSYARVTGVLVEVKRASQSGTGIEDASVDLRYGPFLDSSKSASGLWSPVDGYVSYGGATDTWGTRLTPDQVNAPDFGVALKVRNPSATASDTARVDHVRVTVFYVTATTAIGPRSPTVAVDDASIGTRPWSTPGNALAADGAAATINAMIYPEVSHYLRVSGFGFTSLPTQPPSGILLEVKRAAGFITFGLADQAVRLVKNGAIGTTDRSAGNWDTTSSYHAYGAPDDTWGTTWTATDLGSAAFGAAIAAKYAWVSGNDYALVDHIRMTLLYGAFSTQIMRSPGMVHVEQNSDDWYSPEDGATDDGNTAFVRLSDPPSSFLTATGFGFTVPSNAHVDGITVTVNRAARDPGSISDKAVRLVRNGTIGVVDRSRSETWDPVFAVVDHGGPGDTWGQTWTGADVDDPGFGIAVQTQYGDFAGNNDAFIDSIKVTLHYCQ